MIGTVNGRALAAAGLLGTLAVPAASLAQDFSYDPDDVVARREAFIERMVGDGRFERGALTAILEQAVIQQSALNAISRPAERVVPWYEYREIFLNDERIAAGARFWVEHEELVAETSARFGVDSPVILAILGVESLFGERMGSYRVLDALGTLAFAYPPRADFFAGELESFLLIYDEEGPTVLDALGSYAGAMGAGQFIPSSYRAFAVDGDGDGSRDLWQNWSDILASIANYLAVHGWRPGEPIAVAAQQGAAPGIEAGNRLGLDETVGSLRAAGYEFDASLAPDTAAMLVAVEQDESRTAYFVGLQNFHVITRYNRSVKYALAVLELSEAIERRFRESNRQEGP
jgi:membrane-bound lytic murein transglycosylase B